MTPGVETTTGPLGQGLGNAVGHGAGRAHARGALRQRARRPPHLRARERRRPDGGRRAARRARSPGTSGWASSSSCTTTTAITIDGPTSLAFSEDVGAPLRGLRLGRAARRRPLARRGARARSRARSATEDRPHLIVCRTHIGFGSPAVDTAEAHGSFKDADYTEQTRADAGLDAAAVRGSRRGARGVPRQRGARRARCARVGGAARARARRSRARRALARDGRARAAGRPRRGCCRSCAARSRWRRAQASGKVINALAEKRAVADRRLGRSRGLEQHAIAGAASIARGKFVGRNLHFGVREHGMGAIANGLALHGGIRPYVATFLVFSDYMRPARAAGGADGPAGRLRLHARLDLRRRGRADAPAGRAARRAARDSEPRRVAAGATRARRSSPGTRRCAATTGRRRSCSRARTCRCSSRTASRSRRRARRLGRAARAGRRAAGARDRGDRLGAPRSRSTPRARSRRRAGACAWCRCRVSSCFAAQDAAYRESVLPAASPRLRGRGGRRRSASATLLRPGDRFVGMSGFGASAPFKDLADAVRLHRARTSRASRGRCSPEARAPGARRCARARALARPRAAARRSRRRSTGSSATSRCRDESTRRHDPVTLLAIGDVGEPHGRDPRLHASMARRLAGRRTARRSLVLGDVFYRDGPARLLPRGGRAHLDSRAACSPGPSTRSSTQSWVRTRAASPAIPWSRWRETTITTAIRAATENACAQIPARRARLALRRARLRARRRASRRACSTRARSSWSARLARRCSSTRDFRARALAALHAELARLRQERPRSVARARAAPPARELRPAQRRRAGSTRYTRTCTRSTRRSSRRSRCRSRGLTDGGAQHVFEWRNRGLRRDLYRALEDAPGRRRARPATTTACSSSSSTIPARAGRSCRARGAKHTRVKRLGLDWLWTNRLARLAGPARRAACRGPRPGVRRRRGRRPRARRLRLRGAGRLARHAARRVLGPRDPDTARRRGASSGELTALRARFRGACAAVVELA